MTTRLLSCIPTAPIATGRYHNFMHLRGVRGLSSWLFGFTRCIGENAFQAIEFFIGWALTNGSHFPICCGTSAPSCTSEGGRWYLYSVLVGGSQRKATSIPAKSTRHFKSVGEDRENIASYIQYSSRKRAKQEVACKPIY